MTPPAQGIVVDAEVAALADLYIELICQLKAVHDSHSGLEASEYALVAVKRFLDADQAVFACGLTSPLGALAAAIQDVRAGSKPTLFKTVAQPKTGRPLSPSADTVRGIAAGCLEFLHHNAGLKLEDAARFVAKGLEKIGIKVFGRSQSITSSTVQGWRNEMDGRNSDSANRFFKSYVARLTEAAGAQVTPASGRKLVSDALSAVVAEGLASDDKKSE